MGGSAGYPEEEVQSRSRHTWRVLRPPLTPRCPRRGGDHAGESPWEAKTRIGSYTWAPTQGGTVGRSRGELDAPELARAVQAGDCTAISRALDLCLPALRQRLTSRLGVSPEDCEDLLQEVRIAFLAAAPHFRGECSLHSFLCEIASHKAIDHLRARRRELAGERTREARPPGQLDPGLSRVVERLAAREMLSLLTPRERQVVELYYLEERSYREISELLGISYGTISALKGEALLKLRRLGSQGAAESPLQAPQTARTGDQQAQSAPRFQSGGEK
jgi:RNA polymerase sigma-70 factor (ECF subfamily)